MPKKLIYLVEDDAGIVDVYKTGLELIGKFGVEVFYTCKDIKDRIKELSQEKAKRPDLILLDLILPECNGVEILEELKNTEETKDIPVIILTNYTSSEIERRGIEVGTDDYLTKTEVTPTNLAKIVKDRLKDK